MGEVYRARDARLGRDVRQGAGPTRLVDPDVRRAFSSARLERSRHSIIRHICTLHDVGREGDTDFLVMELVDGRRWRQRLSRGALPTTEVLRLGGQIADALDRAHRAG